MLLNPVSPVELNACSYVCVVCLRERACVRAYVRGQACELLLVSPAPIADEKHRRYLRSIAAPAPVPLRHVNALSKMYAAASKRVAASLSIHFINLFEGTCWANTNVLAHCQRHQTN